MVERKPEWPEADVFPILAIKAVTDNCAYSKLDEFNERGLLHNSEISHSWIRNTRDFIREKQILRTVSQTPVKNATNAGDAGFCRGEK